MTAESNLAAALARIDHAYANAEIRAARADLAHAETKEAEVRAALARLAERIGSFASLDADAVAAAVLAGAELADAALAGETRRELEERQAALSSSLGPIRARIDDLRQNLRETEARARRPIVDAAKAYAAHLRERQRKAALELVECDAGLVAIASGLNCQLTEAEASRRAREGVIGDRGLLREAIALRPSGDLLAILQPLADKSEAVRGFPTEIALR